MPKAKRSKRANELKTLAFGMNSLNVAQPFSNRAAKTLKKRVQSNGLQSDLVALIFVNR